MEEVLAAGRRPTMADFSGLPSIANEAYIIAVSPFAPEFVALIMDEGSEPESSTFAAEVLVCARQDLAINGLVEVMAERRPLPEALERRCFNSWLALASGRDNPTSVRTASLKGALLMKRQDSRRALRLAAHVVANEPDDAPDYLAHAARIGGFLHAELPNPGIIDFLKSLLELDGAADEAAFELGMSEVGSAFEASSASEVLDHLRLARAQFEHAFSLREGRADARLLASAVGALDDFYERRIDKIPERLESLRLEAFAYSTYSAYESDFITGTKPAQVAAWASLAIKLETLSEALEKPAWWDAVRIIENELLAVYTASRSIFRRSDDGGLEWLVRPRIEHSLSQHRAQLYVLRDWLREKGAGELGAAAADLIERTESALAGKQGYWPPYRGGARKPWGRRRP